MHVYGGLQMSPSRIAVLVLAVLLALTGGAAPSLAPALAAPHAAAPAVPAPEQRTASPPVGEGSDVFLQSALATLTP
jgi:hypothetical protein